MYLYSKEMQTDQACENQSREFEKSPILLSFLYYKLIISYTNGRKSFLLMQKLMGFLMQFTETVYYNRN